MIELYDIISTRENQFDRRNRRNVTTQRLTLIEYLWVVRFLVIASVVTAASSRSEEFVKTHYQYMGQLYAGNSQFPWVVEIRHQDSENWTLQEEWSVGNLIGPKYVLTTCSAVANFVKIAGLLPYAVMPKPYHLYKVMYTPDYPYYGAKWYVNRFIETAVEPRDVRTGTRSVLRMTPHPFCSPHSYKYFWGIAEIASPIKPFRLFVNYAPAVLDRSELNKLWFFFKTKPHITGQVGAWGRDLEDPYSFRTMLFNYKVQYEVRVVDPKYCKAEQLKYGWYEWNTEGNDIEFDNNTYCLTLWDPDNNMGTVCDHDRGAPVVYEDVFIGVVVTGANKTECSNLNPLPFVVQSIIEAQVYWANVERHILSYYITNNTHLFPGLSGYAQSESPPLHNASFTILLILGLLLIRQVLRRLCS